MIGIKGIISFNKEKFHKYLHLIKISANKSHINKPDDLIFNNKSHYVELFNNNSDPQIYKDTNNIFTYCGTIYEKIFNTSLKKKYFVEKLNKEFKTMSTWNGSYVAIHYNKKKDKYWISTDENSIIPIYYYSEDSMLIFSWEVNTILQCITKHGINYEHAFTWLLSGGRYYDNSTRFNSINRLEPGSVLEIDKNGLKYHKPHYFEYKPKNYSEKVHIDHCINQLEKSLKKRTKGINSLLFGMSGGIDSRILLSKLEEVYDRDIFCYTYGPKIFNEKIIASQVTSELGIENHRITYPNDIYIKYSMDGVSYSGGASLFKHGVQPHLFNTLKNKFNTKYLIQGSALDLVLGSTFSFPEMAMIKNKQDWFNHIYKRIKNFSKNGFISLFKNKKLGLKFFNMSMEKIERAYNNIEGENLIDINDAFSFEYRIKRWYNQNLVYSLYTLQPILPTYDKDFLKCVSEVPSNLRLNSKFRIKLLMEINKSLSNIKIDSSMQPAWLSYPFDNLFKALQEKIDSEKLKLWYSSGKQIYLPSDRYEANFLEWFRVYPRYGQFLKEKLLNDSILCKDYLENIYIKKIIEDHINGVSENHKILQMLVSIEESNMLANNNWSNSFGSFDDYSQYFD